MSDIRNSWEKVEPGYFDRNKKYIDKNGWLTINGFVFKSFTKRTKKLFDIDMTGFSPKIKPKTNTHVKVWI